MRLASPAMHRAPSLRRRRALPRIVSHVSRLACIGLCAALLPAATSAEEADPENAKRLDGGRDAVEELVVYGRAAPQIGTATSASQGRVGYADLELRPIARVGELLETVPGLIATQHSGPGKSNQLFLRGFNLDHGTDFAVFFDGVPVNLRTPRPRPGLS